jgi:hypothetical protein
VTGTVDFVNDVQIFEPNILSASELPPDTLIMKPGSNAAKRWLGVAGNGVFSGAMCGSLAGTCVFPILGTFYGLIIGTVLGLVGGVVVGPITAWSMRNGASIRQTFRRTQLFTGLAPFVLGCLAAVFTAIKEDDLGPLVLLTPVGVLVGLAPVMIAAAWSASDIFRRSVVEELRTSIDRGQYGFVVRMWHALAVSAAIPVTGWLVFAVSQAF